MFVKQGKKNSPRVFHKYLILQPKTFSLTKGRFAIWKDLLQVPRNFHYEEVFYVLSNYTNVLTLELRTNWVGSSSIWHLKSDTDATSRLFCVQCVEWQYMDISMPSSGTLHKLAWYSIKFDKRYPRKELPSLLVRSLEL